MAWIISCESTNETDRVFELGTHREPPASAFERQMCGFDGHEAQMAVTAALLRGAHAAAGAKRAKGSAATSKAEAKRQRERAFGTTSRIGKTSAYPRAEEARAYRALWLSDKKAWLESQKRRWSRWRELRKSLHSAKLFVSHSTCNPIVNDDRSNQQA